MFSMNHPFLLVYVQLLIGEFVYLKHAPCRRGFVGRLAASIVISGAATIFYQKLELWQILPVMRVLDWVIVWLLAAGTAAVCWKIRLSGILFVSVGSYAIQHIGSSVRSIANQFIIIPPDYSLLSAVGYHLIVAALICLLILRKNDRFYETADRRQVLISTVLIVICIVLSSLRDTCRKDALYMNVYDALACISCLMIQFSISAAEKMQEEKRTLELIISQQHEQHELSKQAVEMMGVKLHNIRSQIRAVQESMSAEESHKLDGLKRTMQIYASMANTGNATVDAVLMEKGLMCEINTIRFSYIVDGAQMAFMEAVDVFSLLNNILDNAIESEMKEEEKDNRMISLRIVKNGEMVLVNAENYCNYPVDFDRMETTKPDKMNHGFGMKGIRYVVDKYHGKMKFSQEDAIVRLAIVFPVD